MKRRNMFSSLVAVTILAGCTTAGPYVTNISSDGRNGLNIEKCAVKLNAFMGTVSTTECTSQRIQLTPYQSTAPNYAPSSRGRSIDAQLMELKQTPGLSYEEYQRRYQEIIWHNSES